jgi:septal ring-binding cell division protein DamX
VFNKLFGKKNDGFYLQIEDDNNAPKPEAKAKSKPAAQSEKVAKVAAEPAPTTSVAPVAPVSATQVAPAKASDPKTEKEMAKAAKEAAKAAKKSVKKTDDKKAEAKKAAAAPVPVAAPVPTAPPITNFATDYLIKPSSTSSRRRPGANMGMFIDMARQVQTPVNIKK